MNRYQITGTIYIHRERQREREREREKERERERDRGSFQKGRNHKPGERISQGEIVCCQALQVAGQSGGGDGRCRLVTTAVPGGTPLQMSTLFHAVLNRMPRHAVTKVQYITNFIFTREYFMAPFSRWSRVVGRTLTSNPTKQSGCFS